MTEPFEQHSDDLGGKVKVLSQIPVFIGTYSRVYRGKNRENGEMVSFLSYCSWFIE
jgi:hypothetical protein